MREGGGEKQRKRWKRGDYRQPIVKKSDTPPIYTCTQYTEYILLSSFKINFRDKCNMQYRHFRLIHGPVYFCLIRHTIHNIENIYNSIPCS